MVARCHEISSAILTRLYLRKQSHDDVIKWKHFLRHWSFVRGIHRWPASQRQVTRSFDIFFDLRLNKRLSKQSLSWWFETPSCSLWRHCNIEMINGTPIITVSTLPDDDPSSFLAKASVRMVTYSATKYVRDRDWVLNAQNLRYI